MNQYRLVVDKIEHTKNGYIYHLINLNTKEFTSTEIINPLSRKFGIGKYYDDINPEFMDAFEVVVLRQEAEGKASAKVEADLKEQQQREEIKAVGRERLKEIIPDYAQAVIIACEREDRSDVHTFFFHHLIFFNGYTSVFAYLFTCIHIYLPEYLRTCLCTVVRRDVCWYGDTGVRWCVVTSLRLSVFTYFRTSVYPYRSICVHGQIFPFVCPCICA